MRILGLIPARGGSKGVPGKNIKLMHGKPLISYTIVNALKSNLTEVIVSTDDEKIAKVAKESGAKVPFLRPKELATDTSKSIDVAIHALQEMENLKSQKYDAVMLLQPTAPFRSTDSINYAIELLSNNKDADSVISVIDVEATHPARMKFLEDGYLVDPPFCEEYENQNRQELKPMYIRNGAIYLTKRDILLGGSYKGKKCLGLEMNIFESVNIDTMHDFEYASWIYEKHLEI